MRSFYLTIFYLLIISACSYNNQSIKPNTIAYDLKKTILLSEQDLQKWLVINKSLSFLSHEEKINAYFLYEALFNKQDILKKEVVEKMKFFTNHTDYQQASNLIKKRVKSQATVKQSQVDQLFEQSKKTNTNKKHKVRLYQIFKRYPLNASDKQKNELLKSMNAIHSQITSLDSFKKLASLESNSQSRLQNGLIGNVKSGLFPPALDKMVMNMKKGELSEVLKGSTGLLLFYCEKHIQAQYKTDKQLYQQAYDKVFKHQSNLDWQKILKDKKESMDILYFWDALLQEKDNAVVVSTAIGQIKKKEVMWLLNTDKEIKSMVDINKKTIENITSEFLVKKLFFQSLNKNEQFNIVDTSQQKLKKMVSDQVLVTLVSDRFKEPSQESIKKYYLQYKDLFIKPERFQVSVLALEINDDTKSQVYLQAQEIYDSLINNKLNFDSAISQYSTLNHLLINGQTQNLSSRQIASSLGINAYKQILKMKINQVSDLVESDKGYLYIIRLDKKLPEQTATFKEAKKQALDKLSNNLLKNLQNQITNEIIDKLKITIVPTS